MSQKHSFSFTIQRNSQGFQALGVAFTTKLILIYGLLFQFAAATAETTHSTSRGVEKTPNPTASIPAHCLTGLSPISTADKFVEPYVVRRQYGTVAIDVAAPVKDWLTAHKWPQAYTKWKSSYGFDNHYDFDEDQLTPKPATTSTKARLCTSKKTSFRYLIMHRHLLQSMDSLWPNVDDPFKGWIKFPASAEDYPEEIQNQFFAWPDNVLKNAKLLDSLGMMNHEEMLSRWPTEEDLAHWMICGSDELGLTPDSIYHALINNALSLSKSTAGVTAHNLDLYLFWKAHGWMNRIWNMYRKKIGLTPYEADLQAAMIRQCQELEYWATQNYASDSQKSRKIDTPLFSHGYLNPEYSSPIRLIGEVTGLERNANGRTFLKLDLRLVGVKPIWVSAYTDIAEGSIQIGDRFNVIGYANNTQQGASEHGNTLKTSFLEAHSIQSPK